MNIDYDTLKQFLQDHWLVLVAAVVVLFIVVKAVKTMMKWVLVAAIVVGVFAYGGYTMDDLKQVGTKVQADLKNEAMKAMAGEAEKATYTLNNDGSYTVKTPNLELDGVPNSGKVKVKFRSISLGTWDMEGATRQLVVQAQANAKASAK